MLALMTFAALTVEQTIEFPTVLDYVRFQLLATPMAAMSRSLLRIHWPHLIDDPAGQRFKRLSLISSLRPGAAIPVPLSRCRRGFSPPRA
jgi:hypothetical protein